MIGRKDKPPLHARDHRPGGADPIRGIKRWAYLSLNTPVTVAHGIAVNLSARALPNFSYGADFYTNDPETFANDKKTISAVDYWGIKISRPGVFEFHLDGQFVVMGATKVGTIDYVILAAGGTGPARSSYGQGRKTIIGTDTWDPDVDNHIFFTDIVSAQGATISIDGPDGGNGGTPTDDNTLPAYVLFTATNGDTVDRNARAGLWIKELGPEAFYGGSWS